MEEEDFLSIIVNWPRSTQDGLVYHLEKETGCGRCSFFTDGRCSCRTTAKYDCGKGKTGHWEKIEEKK